MDLFIYNEKFGSGAIERLAKKALTNVNYLSHIILYRKRPGADLAHRLIVASGNVLTIEAIMVSSQAMAIKRNELRLLRLKAATVAAKEAKATLTKARRSAAARNPTKPRATAAHA